MSFLEQNIQHIYMYIYIYNITTFKYQTEFTFSQTGKIMHNDSHTLNPTMHKRTLPINQQLDIINHTTVYYSEVSTTSLECITLSTWEVSVYNV